MIETFGELVAPYANPVEIGLSIEWPDSLDGLELRLAETGDPRNHRLMELVDSQLAQGGTARVFYCKSRSVLAAVGCLTAATGEAQTFACVVSPRFLAPNAVDNRVMFACLAVAAR